MGWDIRKHSDGLEQAFEWYLRAPGFLKASWEPYLLTERDAFLATLKAGVNYSGWDQGKHTVLTHVEDKGGGAAEGHLFCAPEASLDLLAATIRYTRAETLKDFEKLVCCVSRKHKTLNSLMLHCGFEDTGLRSWRGVYRSSPLEILYYLARA